MYTEATFSLYKYELQISMKCLSILRYMSDHLEHMPLGVTTRLTMTHDVPILMSQMIEMKPWFHIKDGQTKVFHGSEWIRVDTTTNDQEFDLPKLEAQAWLTLYNLMSKKESKDKYDLHHYRLNVLSKLSGFINDSLIHQLPILANFKEWLLKLNMANASSSGSGVKDLVMIEDVPGIYQSLEETYKGKYDQIAANQKEEFLGDTSEAWQKEAGRILDTLDSDVAQTLISSQKAYASSGSTTSSCAQCHDPSPKQRCSNCKQARYCSRECQTKHWPRHKTRCCNSTSTTIKKE